MIHLLIELALAIWVLQLLLVTVNLAVTPRLARELPPGVRLPRVSLIVPARNEEWQIGRAVASHLAQEYPDYEVIVVNDRSTDRTSEILASLPDPGGRLRVVEGTETPRGWLGKPHALAQGARAATGALFLFVDADVVYHPRTLSQAVATLEADGADLLCLAPRMEARGFWENVLMPCVLWSFFSGPGFLANLDRPRWLAMGGGSGNLVRREVYDALGGHDSLRNSVVDDVRLALAAKRAGFRTRAVRAEDHVAVRMYRGLAQVFNGFSKNIAYAFTGFLGVVLGFVTAATVISALVPPLVLLAAVAGVAMSPRDVPLAAAAAGLMFFARLLLAAAVRDPLWPAWTHPFMAAVWASMIGRSLYLRFVRRKLSWRGREFDALGARF